MAQASWTTAPSPGDTLPPCPAALLAPVQQFLLQRLPRPPNSTMTRRISSTTLTTMTTPASWMTSSPCRHRPPGAPPSPARPTTGGWGSPRQAHWTYRWARGIITLACTMELFNSVSELFYSLHFIWIMKYLQRTSQQLFVKKYWKSRPPKKCRKFYVGPCLTHIIRHY